jgi:hypothetical protein
MFTTREPFTMTADSPHILMPSGAGMVIRSHFMKSSPWLMATAAGFVFFSE